jgi:hypothetical protein
MIDINPFQNNKNILFFLFILSYFPLPKIKDGDSKRTPRSYNTYLFYPNINPRLGLPKLRKETIYSFIFLSISTPKNKRW